MIIKYDGQGGITIARGNRRIDCDMAANGRIAMVGAYNEALARELERVDWLSMGYGYAVVAYGAISKVYGGVKYDVLNALNFNKISDLLK